MRWAPLAAALALAACSHRPPPAAPRPHYVVGPAWEARGVWHYPEEQFRYDATGLAERVPDRSGLTTDGEAFDASALAAAHPTLQLPAVLRVSNLETGREVLVRANDRGPADPGRILGLTRRAADLLGLPSGPAQVRVQVEDGPSQALRDRLQGGPRGITAAPRSAVSAEALPPPGSGGRGVVRVATAGPSDSGPANADPAVPDRLPERVTQGVARPGRLWIRAGRFSQQSYANIVSSKLSGMPVQVEREAGVQRPGFLVVAGPFATVEEADAALDRALRAGVTDAVIVVE